MTETADIFREIFLPHIPTGVHAVRDKLLELSFSQMIYVARGLRAVGSAKLDVITPEELAHILNEWATEHKLKQQRDDQEAQERREEAARKSAEAKSIFQTLDLDSQEAETFQVLAKRLRENKQFELAQRIEEAIKAFERRHEAT